jgi:glucose/arabinose dehydrogenase
MALSRRNGNLRLSVLLVALLVPLALIGGLVIALDAGREGLRKDVEGGGSPGPVAAGPVSAAAGVRLARIGSFDAPVHVTAPPGDRRRVFVVEQGGTVRVLVGGRVRGRPFLDVSGRITSGGERGLLSMAFAPDYRTSRRFYVYFTDRNGDSRVEEYRRSLRSPNRADRSTRRPILFARQPFENHNGGLLLFGPDGHLYLGLGDGGSAGDPGNRAQDLDTLLGKILRIDPRRSGAGGHTSPRSNPLVGRPGRDEIYAWGLRNPWRFSFDRRNGDLYAGDVGQDEIEEIDYAPRGSAQGRNYGWSCFEGTRRYDASRTCPGAVGPVLQYRHAGGECSVTGGVVVRDPGLPALAGRYVYGDFCEGEVRSFRLSGGRATGDGRLGLRVSSLSSFGEDARGRVYATSLGGPVYRLAAR